MKLRELVAKQNYEGKSLSVGFRPLPQTAFDRYLTELPEGREIVAYCRRPYCVLSFEAVANLRARGYQVRRLEDGFPEWKAAGLEVVTA
jgi:rhodanese-related sulfurtransferase